MCVKIWLKNVKCYVRFTNLFKFFIILHIHFSIDEMIICFTHSMKLRVLSYRPLGRFIRKALLLVLIVLPFLLVFASYGNCVADSECGSACSTFSTKILFPKGSHSLRYGNQAAVDSIRAFLSQLSPQDISSVTIIGSYSPEGEFNYNARLAKRRANALASVLKDINPEIVPLVMSRHSMGGIQVDYKNMRSAELRIEYRKHRDVMEKDSRDNESWVAEIPNTGVDENVGSDTSSWNAVDYIQPSSGAGVLSHSGNESRVGVFAYTNILYDAALIPNVGIGISVTDRITVLADWMFARWSNDEKRRYWRIYGGDIEARYHIGKFNPDSPLAGHHIGVYASLACYDFQTGRSHQGVLSDKYNYAAGVSYTYSLPVAKRLNIDFSLGVGVLWGKYKKHIPVDDCDVWLSTNRLCWFGPTRAGVSLVWLIGDGVANSRKGGDK